MYGSGFPLGAETTAIKVEQARQALWLGAREIDMVMNLGLFKDRDYLGYGKKFGKRRSWFMTVVDIKGYH